MKTIPVDVDCFPKLREDGFLKATQHSFGRAMKDLFFNRFADLVISNTNPHSNIDHTLKHIPKERIAIDFFKWDYQLAEYRITERYEAYLQEIRQKGIDKCVGMDFSLWHVQPGPTILNNFYLNMDRLERAQRFGFQAIFNWNNVLPEFKPIFEDILPKHVPIVMADANHDDPKFLERELEALKMFTSLTKVDVFVIQSSRMDIKYMSMFLKELLDNGIGYHLIPSQTALLGGVRNKQAFEELIGRKMVGIP
jgi:hypothetical protein